MDYQYKYFALNFVINCRETPPRSVKSVSCLAVRKLAEWTRWQMAEWTPLPNKAPWTSPNDGSGLKPSRSPDSSLEKKDTEKKKSLRRNESSSVKKIQAFQKFSTRMDSCTKCKDGRSDVWHIQTIIGLNGGEFAHRGIWVVTLLRGKDNRIAAREKNQPKPLKPLRRPETSLGLVANQNKIPPPRDPILTTRKKSPLFYEAEKIIKKR